MSDGAYGPFTTAIPSDPIVGFIPRPDVGPGHGMLVFTPRAALPAGYHETPFKEPFTIRPGERWFVRIEHGEAVGYKETP